MADALTAAGVRRVQPLLVRGFGVIARRRLRGAFRAVRVLHPERLAGVTGPVVVYLNHPSWWDPLLCLAVAQRLLPGRAHYAPISAASLVKYPMFERLGMFPVEQDSRKGALQFLRGAEAVLASEAVLWVTAQGHFTDARVRPVVLKGGLEALLARLDGVTVLPMAVEYPFWDQRLPEALVSFGLPGASLEAGLEAAQDELAAAALRRDGAEFVSLLEGGSGTSGVYGWWQRVRGAGGDH